MCVVAFMCKGSFIIISHKMRLSMYAYARLCACVVCKRLRTHMWLSVCVHLDACAHCGMWLVRLVLKLGSVPITQSSEPMHRAFMSWFWNAHFGAQPDSEGEEEKRGGPGARGRGSSTDISSVPSSFKLQNTLVLSAFCYAFPLYVRLCMALAWYVKWRAVWLARM